MSDGTFSTQKSCPRCSAGTPREATLGPCPLVGLSKPSPKKRAGKAAKEESGDEAGAAEMAVASGSGKAKKVRKAKVKKEDVKDEEDVAQDEVGGEAISSVVKEELKQDVEEAIRVAHGG